MICPYCGSKNIDIESVDIGIGFQQVAPASCECGARQFDHNEDRTTASDEEKARGWWAPESTVDRIELQLAQIEAAFADLSKPEHASARFTGLAMATGPLAKEIRLLRAALTDLYGARVILEDHPLLSCDRKLGEP